MMAELPSPGVLYVMQNHRARDRYDCEDRT